MCWSGSSVRADLCIMTGDRRLLQIDKERRSRADALFHRSRDGSEAGCENMDVFRCSGWRVGKNSYHSECRVDGDKFCVATFSSESSTSTPHW